MGRLKQMIIDTELEAIIDESMPPEPDYNPAEPTQTAVTPERHDNEQIPF